MAQYDNGEKSLWYRAEGESLQAILEIWDPAKIPGHAGHKASASAILFNLKKLGVLDHPAIQVEQGEIGFPRAYQASATLWADPLQQGVFYIEVPVDYKGQHYAPPGAVALDAAQAKKATGSLFMGGWGDSVPLTAQFTPRQGTDLPADFDAASKIIGTDRYYKPNDFKDQAVFRATGDLHRAIQTNINWSPKPAQRIIHDYDGVQGLKDDKGASPALWALDEGYYLVYPDRHATGPQAEHDGLKAATAAEYLWARFNADDRALGITPPEPPKALSHLYEKTMFVARGLSHATLDRDYKAQGDMFKRLRAFEDKTFGDPDPRTVFNAGGTEIRSYAEKPSPEWQDDGAFKGFRFDWRPLNGPGRARYAIAAKLVPPGWTAVTDHPGIYLPDPTQRPNEANACTNFNIPSLQRREAVSGANPIVTIRNPATRFPRAERQWPSIHIDYDRDDRLPLYYIDMPVDYRGHVHRPAQAERMTKLRWNEFRSSLGDMYEPDWVRPQPVSVPPDFKPKKVKEGESRFYILAGASLAAYRAVDTEQKTSDDLRAAFMKKLGSNGSYSYHGKQLLGVDFKKNPPRGWAPVNDRKDMYLPDPSSAKGRRIMQQFAALPERPDLSTLHEKFNVEAGAPTTFPRLHQLWSHDLVAVEYPKTIAAPQDAIAVDADVFQWLREEQSDIQCGMVSVPAPLEIADFLARCKTVSGWKPVPSLPRPD